MDKFQAIPITDQELHLMLKSAMPEHEGDGIVNKKVDKTEVI